jgi:hypothetical protein
MTVDEMRKVAVEEILRQSRQAKFDYEQEYITLEQLQYTHKRLWNAVEMINLIYLECKDGPALTLGRGK